MKSRRDWTFRPKVCVHCEREYIPTSSIQKVCIDCRDEYRRLQHKEYHSRPEVRAKEAKRKYIYYQKFSRFKSEILRDTDFKCIVERYITTRIGDMLVTKTIARNALRELGIIDAIRSASHEWECLYRVTEELMKRHGGRPYSETIKGGVIFKFPRKER
jgi:hypothetical protein